MMMMMMMMMMGTGGRNTSEEVHSRRIVNSAIIFIVTIHKAWDFVALWATLFWKEMAFHLQLLKHVVGKERKSASKVVTTQVPYTH